MKELQSRIKRMLKRNEAYRDSDAALMARVWYEDFQRLDIGSTKNEHYVHFLIALKDNKLSNWDSVTRCRRKVQEIFPQLRGKKYEFRRNNTAAAVKKELREME
tara:strand:+ start:217 stop:528 length:312 start_codon:yes stop_codon:yes gene_type:complete